MTEERCTNPTCSEHWPPPSTTVYLTFHTHPDQPPREGPTYPRRDIQWARPGKDDQ